MTSTMTQEKRASLTKTITECDFPLVHSLRRRGSRARADRFIKRKLGFSEATWRARRGSKDPKTYHWRRALSRSTAGVLVNWKLSRYIFYRGLYIPELRCYCQQNANENLLETAIRSQYVKSPSRPLSLSFCMSERTKQGPHFVLLRASLTTLAKASQA